MRRQYRESSSMLHDQWRFKEAACHLLLRFLEQIRSINPRYSRTRVRGGVDLPQQRSCCLHKVTTYMIQQRTCRFHKVTTEPTWYCVRLVTKMVPTRGRINMCYTQRWHQDPFPSKSAFVLVMWQRWRRCCGRTLNVRKICPPHPSW